MKKAMLFVALATAIGFKTADAVELTPTGDVRVRYESLQNKYDGGTANYSNDRWRTRVRVGLNAWINEELSAGVGIATDADNDGVSYKGATSRNQSYATLFNAKSIWLNEAYVEYHPMSLGLDGKVNFLLGKRDVAKTIVRVDDLLYDGDLTLEGTTLQYGKAADGKEKDGLIFIAGYYFLDQASPASTDLAGYNNPARENDPFLTIVQVAYKGGIADYSYLIGAADNNFRNLNHFAATYDANNVNVTDRNILELFGSFGGQVTETLPWQIRGQYAHNTGDKAINDKRNAWLAGVSIGDAKQLGQWAVDFNYNRIQKDGLFPYFSDSDRKVGNFNSSTQGWEVGATYHLVQNMTVGAKYYNYSQIDNPGDLRNPHLHTLQCDMVVKF